MQLDQILPLQTAKDIVYIYRHGYIAGLMHQTSRLPIYWVLYLHEKMFRDTLYETGGYDPEDGTTFDPLDGFHRIKAADGNDTHHKVVQYKRPTGQNRYNISIRELESGATYLFRVSAINKTFYPTEQAKTACLTGDLADCVKNSNAFFTTGGGPSVRLNQTELQQL